MLWTLTTHCSLTGTQTILPHGDGNNIRNYGAVMPPPENVTVAIKDGIYTFQ